MLGQSSPPSSGVSEHRGESPLSIASAVVTISDTRIPATDRSGTLIVQFLEGAGHRVLDRQIIPDEPDRIRSVVSGYASRGDIQVVLMTGGTGISPRDQTYETMLSLLNRPLPGYGELFRFLSYEEIGSAAILSRALGGVIGRMAVFTMPGSTAAVRLAMEKLILPELTHIIREISKGA